MRRVAGTLTAACLVVAGLAAVVDAPALALDGSSSGIRSGSTSGVARAAQGAPGSVPLDVYGYATEHRVYVGVVTNRGTYTRSMDQLGAAVDEALAAWTSTVPAGFSSFVRVGPVGYAATRVSDPASGCGQGGGGVDTVTQSDVVDEARKVLGVPTSTPALATHTLVIVPAACAATHGRGASADLTTGWASGDGGMVVAEADPARLRQTLIHEIGHTLGLSHGWRGCPVGQPCTPLEYGDCYSPMGTATDMVISTAHRAMAGVLAPGELATVDGDLGPSEQDVFIGPRGSTTGVRGLGVLDPESGDTYYFDYRDFTGLDREAPAPGCTAGVTVTSLGLMRSTTLTPRSLTPVAELAWRSGDSIHVGSLTVQVLDTTPGVGAWLHVTVLALPALPVLSAPHLVGTPWEGREVSTTSGTFGVPVSTRYRWYLDGTPVRDHNTWLVNRSRVALPTTLRKVRSHVVAEVTAIAPGYRRAVVQTAPVRVAQRGVFGRPTLRGARQGEVRAGQTVRAFVGGPAQHGLFGVERVLRWRVNGRLMQRGAGRRFTVPEGVHGYLQLFVTVHGRGYVRETNRSNPYRIRP